MLGVMSTVTRAWTRDPVTAWSGVGFIVLLLASEAALTLPDEHASAVSVARFYTAHEGIIITLQVVGFVACALLGWFAWRHRRIDQRIAGTGLVLAVLAAAPGILTVGVALVAAGAGSGPAGDWNRLIPRGDDLLFVGIVVFAAAVLASRAAPTWLRVLAGVVAACCLLRLALEIFGGSGGPLASVGPVAFLVLVAGMTWLAFRGYPHRATAASAG